MTQQTGSGRPAASRRPAALADTAFQRLRAELLEGGPLSARGRLVAGELAERLGMSRTPVREALDRLARLGHLARLDGGGYEPRRYRRRDARDVWELQLLLEPLAAERAALGTPRTGRPGREGRLSCSSAAPSGDPVLAHVLDLLTERLAAVQADSARREARATDATGGRRDRAHAPSPRPRRRGRRPGGGGAGAGASLASTAYGQLRTAIVSGHLAPGTILSEGRVASELAVSRTPVRAALRRLELEGHIERDPRGRPVVRVLTERELAQIFGIREVLEGYAARLAAARISDPELDDLEALVERDWRAWRAADPDELGRLNDALHGIVMEASRNRMLVEIVDELRWRVSGLSAFAVGDRSDSRHFVAEHAEMLRLLREGDADGVEALVRRHLRTARDLLTGRAHERTHVA